MIGCFRFCDLVWWTRAPFTLAAFIACLYGAPCYFTDDESLACLTFEVSEVMP